jgi:dTDP-4-dehydrorhamnose 3,5-epimerase
MSMKFIETPLSGAYIINLEKRGDDRGFFARLFDVHEFSGHGLESSFVQVNDSLSVAQGTLRGLHYQLAPHAEVKLVRCIHGVVWDVIVDLRPDSPTFGGWHGAELSQANRSMMYVPRGFAHGHVTLEAESEIIYLVSNFYAPESERGLRWDDPRFAIDWPVSPTVISDKDRGHPDFDPQHHLASR